MIPKIVIKESGPPEGMTQEQLEKILRPNFLAFTRIIARNIIEEQEEKQKKIKEVSENVGSV